MNGVAWREIAALKIVPILFVSEFDAETAQVEFIMNLPSGRCFRCSRLIPFEHLGLAQFDLLTFTYAEMALEISDWIRIGYGLPPLRRLLQ